MKIMIVDDHADMRRMLRTIVSNAVHDENEFIECSDGQEAVEQFSLHHPDYVLMDVQLKEMNGFTAAEQIYEQQPAAKVIFVTSHNTPVFRMKAIQLHAHGFVSKENLMELTTLVSK